MKELGLPHDPALIAYGEHSIPGGRAAMQKILETGATFTAVAASSDQSAYGAMETLRQAGLRIPEDIALDPAIHGIRIGPVR